MLGQALVSRPITCGHASEPLPAAWGLSFFEICCRQAPTTALRWDEVASKEFKRRFLSFHGFFMAFSCFF